MSDDNLHIEPRGLQFFGGHDFEPLEFFPLNGPEWLDSVWAGDVMQEGALGAAGENAHAPLAAAHSGPAPQGEEKIALAPQVLVPPASPALASSDEVSAALPPSPPPLPPPPPPRRPHYGPANRRRNNAPRRRLSTLAESFSVSFGLPLPDGAYRVPRNRVRMGGDIGGRRHPNGIVSLAMHSKKPRVFWMGRPLLVDTRTDLERQLKPFGHELPLDFPLLDVLGNLAVVVRSGRKQALLAPQLKRRANEAGLGSANGGPNVAQGGGDDDEETASAVMALSA